MRGCRFNVLALLGVDLVRIAEPCGAVCIKYLWCTQSDLVEEIQLGKSVEWAIRFCRCTTVFTGTLEHFLLSLVSAGSTRSQLRDGVNRQSLSFVLEHWHHLCYVYLVILDPGKGWVWGVSIFGQLVVLASREVILLLSIKKWIRYTRIQNMVDSNCSGLCDCEMCILHVPVTTKWSQLGMLCLITLHCTTSKVAWRCNKHLCFLFASRQPGGFHDSSVYSMTAWLPLLGRRKWKRCWRIRQF